MGFLYSLYTRLTKPPSLDFALFMKFCHKICYLLNGCVCINSMLIIQIYTFDVKSLQTPLYALFNHIKGAIYDLPTLCNLNAKFRSHHDFIPKVLNRTAYKLLICVGSIHFGSIKKVNAPIISFGDKLTHLFNIFWLTIAIAHTHTA